MLKSIYIHNYAIITDLSVDFGEGFSVMTGETGAGKSIILGALSLILGNRAESKALRTDTDKCIIEAHFDISAYKHLSTFFVENELDFANECIIRREITANAKSRAFINDTPVSLIVLKQLSSQLIDIHSQHENLLIANEGYQREVLDTVAQNQTELSHYQHAFATWTDARKQLQHMQQLARKSATELDYIRFQYQQLADARLVTDEQEELERELETLTHAEEIKTELHRAAEILDGEQACLSMIKELTNNILRIDKFLPQNINAAERLQTLYVELKDISNDLSHQSEKVEYNPERLLFVEERLSLLYSLQKKFAVDTVDELIEKRDAFEKQLTSIEHFDEEIERLKNELDRAFNLMLIAADVLTTSRRKALPAIEQYMVAQLNSLGMPNIRFEIALNDLPECSEWGKDEVQFMFSANKNRELQAVQLVASGGEISRLMLVIKSLIANKKALPTVIFDEIDTGVSGEIAHRMAQIMREMGTAMQVITITHLPQIASKGRLHYKVYKTDEGAQTETRIVQLSAPERIQEIAQMLSGKNVTDAALVNARDLLAEA